MLQIPLALAKKALPRGRKAHEHVVRPVLLSQHKRDIVQLIVRGGRQSVSGIIAAVFGATGYLGRQVVGSLASTGCQIVLPYRGEERSYRRSKVMGDLGQIVPVRWDSRHRESIERALMRCNVVINCLSREFDTRNFTMEHIHIDTPRLIAQIAKEMGVQRFIHYNCLGVSPYSASKFSSTRAKGEDAVREVFPEATILRTGPLCGASDRLFFRYGTMLRYWPLYLVFNPDQKFQPVWVGDAASASIAVLKDINSGGKVYELGGSKIFTNSEWAEYIKDGSRRKKPLVHVPLWWMKFIAMAIQWHRKPRFSMDYLKFSEDKVLSPEALGFADLGMDHIMPIDSIKRVVKVAFAKPLAYYQLPEDLESKETYQWAMPDNERI